MLTVKYKKSKDGVACVNASKLMLLNEGSSKRALIFLKPDRLLSTKDLSIIKISDITEMYPSAGHFICGRGRNGESYMKYSWRKGDEWIWDCCFELVAVDEFFTNFRYSVSEIIRPKTDEDSVKQLKHLLTLYSCEDEIDSLKDGVEIVGQKYYPDTSESVWYKVQFGIYTIELPENIVEFCY